MFGAEHAPRHLQYVMQDHAQATEQQVTIITVLNVLQERPVLELPSMSRHPHGINCLALDPSGVSHTAVASITVLSQCHTMP